MKTRIKIGAVAFAASLAMAGAQADTLFTWPSPTPALESPGSVSASFGSGGGAGAVDLQIQGYLSLDGDNFYIDILSITLNGATVFSGTFDLGGGGIDRILANPNGGSAVKDAVTRTVHISLPVTLTGGANFIEVAYASPTLFEGFDRAGPQGLGDEGWGLNTMTITGAVPEPATALSLLAGLALLGGLRRGRRAA